MKTIDELITYLSKEGYVSYNIKFLGNDGNTYEFQPDEYNQHYKDYGCKAVNFIVNKGLDSMLKNGFCTLYHKGATINKEVLLTVFNDKNKLENESTKIKLNLYNTNKKLYSLINFKEYLDSHTVQITKELKDKDPRLDSWELGWTAIYNEIDGPFSRPWFGDTRDIREFVIESIDSKIELIFCLKEVSYATGGICNSKTCRFTIDVDYLFNWLNSDNEKVIYAVKPAGSNNGVY